MVRIKKHSEYVSEWEHSLTFETVAQMRKLHARKGGHDSRDANIWFRETAAQIKKRFDMAPPAADDTDLKSAAAAAARDIERRIITLRRSHADADPASVLDACAAECLRVMPAHARQRWAAAARRNVATALARAQCARWWLRQLRTSHRRAGEESARQVELVHKRAGCYAGDATVRKRRAQTARNAAVLADLVATNEHGQQITLADLAAKGIANKQIRRAELMTRIAGFEQIARDCGHAGLFVTLTTPSRMHRMRTRPAVEANPRWDGSSPRDAQAWLAGQWAKWRAWAARRGVAVYGFRIAEPNHDGTPHWHALFFHDPAHAQNIQDGLIKYFLSAADAHEPGAEKYRVKLVPIDWQRGSAAGYVAKYVAKNIDGYKIEKDLYGNDSITASQRVEAWAACWGIRQFQQIGGAPVGVWRELRRLHTAQQQNSPAIAKMLEAVNISRRADTLEHENNQRITAAHGWQRYVTLQGGPFVKRKALRAGLLRESWGDFGRYGDLLPDRIIGVQALDAMSESVNCGGLVGTITRWVTARAEIESERCMWEISRAADAPQALERAHRARPWSPVNNCTGTQALTLAERMRQTPEPLFKLRGVRRYPKIGRFQAWGAKTETEGKSWTNPSKSAAPPQLQRN